MRPSLSFCAVILAVALPLHAHANDTKDLRDDPVVQAVDKAIASVVAIRVPRTNGEKDAIGSGVIVDKGGYIVTNRHVTSGKKYVNVKLNSGVETKGEVVIADADLDLAVVRINHDKELPALRLGDREDLRLAEKVIAIGTPFGYEGTVSLGILSAKNREIKMPNDIIMTGLIQHTAAINPGNSGGPLINLKAEVIGINVAMRDGAQNIAFAINATTVTNFLRTNLNAKRVAGIEHGLNCEDRLLAKNPQQVVVRDAAHEELKAGDQIVKVGDLAVRNTFDVERALWHSKPGQKVGVQVIRHGQAMAATLTIAASQGAGSVAANSAVTTSVRSAIER